jgi:hypothetical protein
VIVLIDFLSGALALSFVVAGVFFLRFWRRTRESLFLNFAFAFWLLAANQTIVTMLGAADERSGYAYVLRVFGFLLILYAIVAKNLEPRRPRG